MRAQFEAFPSWLACFALSLLISLTTVAARGEDALRRNFEAEYPAASRKLREFYTNLRISGTETRENDSRQWELGGNGELMRSIVTRQDGSAEVVVADPKLSFTLEKGAGSNQYTVSAMGPAPPHEYADLVQTIRRKAFLASAPYAILADPIAGFVAEKSFQWKGAREIGGPDGKVLRVEWENSPRGGPKRRGSFDFAVDGSWALRGFDFHFPEYRNLRGEVMDVGRHGVLEYQGQESGIPLVRRMRFWSSGPAGNSPETIFEVTKLEPGPVPKDEFTLAAFGISTTPAADPTPVAYYLMGLSALSAMVVLTLRLAARRQARMAEGA